jgi:hypothetical protein
MALSFLILFGDFLAVLWLVKACALFTRPLRLTRNFFDAVLLVFIFGIKSPKVEPLPINKRSYKIIKNYDNALNLQANRGSQSLLWLTSFRYMSGLSHASNSESRQ